MKSVQISYDLFMKLLQYFCLEKEDLHDEIQQAIEEKVDRMASRQRYAQAMAAEDDRERRELLQEYYNKKKLLKRK